MEIFKAGEDAIALCNVTYIEKDRVLSVLEVKPSLCACPQQALYFAGMICPINVIYHCPICGEIGARAEVGELLPYRSVYFRKLEVHLGEFEEWIEKSENVKL